MLAQDIAEIKDGKIITKDGRTVDQIYKGFQIYKSGKAPAEFTAIKETEQYQGSEFDVKRQIDKYWEKKDAEEVLKKKTKDDITMTGKGSRYRVMWGRGLQDYWDFDILSDAVSYAEFIAKQKKAKARIYDMHRNNVIIKEVTGDTFDSLDPDETHDVRDIEKEAKANDYFRKVLFTAERMQLVIMCLKPGEDIGEEVHPTTDQFFRIEEGSGKAVVDGKEINITDGSSVLIKSGRVHNIINDSNKPLRLYTLYSPPQHQDGLIQKEK